MWSENAGWTTHITYITPLADKLKSLKEPTRNSLSFYVSNIRHTSSVKHSSSYIHTWGEKEVSYWGEMGKCERRDWKLQYMMRRRWFVSNLTTINVKIARQPTFPIHSSSTYLYASIGQHLNLYIRPVCGFSERINFMTSFIGHMRCYWKWRCALSNAVWLNWVSFEIIL